MTRQRTTRALLFVLAAMLGACASGGQWERANTSEQERNTHLAACEREAKKLIDRDAVIDQDIESGQEMNFGTSSTSQVLSQSNQFGEMKRFDRIVASCMRNLGYQRVDGDRGWL